MLIDAERIEGQMRHVEQLGMVAAASFQFSDPQVLWRAWEQAREHLKTAPSGYSEDQLIEYALQRQREVSAAATPLVS